MYEVFDFNWDVVAEFEDLAELCNEVTEEACVPESKLGWDVLVDNATGELSLLLVKDELYTFDQSLDRAFTGHESGRANLLIGHCKASLHLDVYVFGQPRRGKVRCFWSLHDVFMGLSLTSFGGQASNWVYQTRARWRVAFEKVLQSCQLIGSLAAVHGQGNGEYECAFFEHFHQRCVGSSAASTPGLLLLLAKFVFSMPQQGGLRVASGKQAATELLRTFVDISAPLLSTGRCNFYVMPECCMLWPRPEPAGTMVCIPISANGLCDLQGIRHLAHGEPHPCRALAKQWARSLSTAGGNWSWTLPMWDVLQLCTTKVGL